MEAPPLLYLPRFPDNSAQRFSYPDLIEAQDIPPSLQEPAVGNFSVLETAIRGQGAGIPRNMNVAEFLTHMAVATAQMMRQENGLRADTPERVYMILMKNFYQQIPLLSNTQLVRVGFAMVFPDQTLFTGSVHTQHVLPRYEGLQGIPYCITSTPASQIDYWDGTLYHKDTNEFTDAGQRMVRFAAENLSRR